VLLLDRRAGQLVATAASGLEEQVPQGVRIPVGKGFAGRIAAQGRPVILNEVDHTKVINPILLRLWWLSCGRQRDRASGQRYEIN
jgi:phosphoserine phosphatase RsbU/P